MSVGLSIAFFFYSIVEIENSEKFQAVIAVARFQVLHLHISGDRDTSQKIIRNASDTVLEIYMIAITVPNHTTI